MRSFNEMTENQQHKLDAVAGPKGDGGSGLSAHMLVEPRGGARPC
jgi:hypothetical protein